MNNIRLLKGELTQTCIVIVYLPSYCVEHKRRYIENVNVVVYFILIYSHHKSVIGQKKIFRILIQDLKSAYSKALNSRKNYEIQVIAVKIVQLFYSYANKKHIF